MDALVGNRWLVSVHYVPGPQLSPRATAGSKEMQKDGERRKCSIRNTDTCVPWRQPFGLSVVSDIVTNHPGPAWQASGSELGLRFRWASLLTRWARAPEQFAGGDQGGG